MPLDPMLQHALAAGAGGLGGYALGQFGSGDEEERARKARLYALLGAGLGGGGSLAAQTFSPQIQALMTALQGGSPAAAPAAPVAAPPAPAPAPAPAPPAAAGVPSPASKPIVQRRAQMTPEQKARLDAKTQQALKLTGLKPSPGSVLAKQQALENYLKPAPPPVAARPARPEDHDALGNYIGEPIKPAAKRPAPKYGRHPKPPVVVEPRPATPASDYQYRVQQMLRGALNPPPAPSPQLPTFRSLAQGVDNVLGGAPRQVIGIPLR